MRIATPAARGLAAALRYLSALFSLSRPSSLIGDAIPLAIVLCFAMARATLAASIDVGTANGGNWLITGGGAVDAPAYNPSDLVGTISITSNGNRTGTFVPAASLADFNGFWYADCTFTLPSNAADITLSFSRLLADDRIVLQLNGTDIGDYLLSTGGVGGPGVMSFPPGPPDVPFTFTDQASATITSGFVVGAVNDLRLIINNTGTASPSAPTKTFQGSGDFTYAQLSGTVTYSVPEPGGLSIVAFAGMAAMARRWQRD